MIEDSIQTLQIEQQWSKSIKQGIHLQTQRNFDEAYKNLFTALETTANFAGNDPRRGISFDRLGDWFLEQKRFQEAEEYYRQGLEAWKIALGEGHPDVSDSHFRIFKVYLEQNQLDKAEHELKIAIEIREKATIDVNLDVQLMEYKYHLVNLYYNLNQYNLVIPIIEWMEPIAEKILRREDQIAFRAADIVSSFYMLINDYNKAEPLVKKRITLLQKYYKEEIFLQVKSLLKLSLIYENNDRIPKYQ